MFCTGPCELCSLCYFQVQPEVAAAGCAPTGVGDAPVIQVSPGLASVLARSSIASLSFFSSLLASQSILFLLVTASLPSHPSRLLHDRGQGREQQCLLPDFLPSSPSLFPCLPRLHLSLAWAPGRGLGSTPSIPLRSSLPSLSHTCQWTQSGTCSLCHLLAQDPSDLDGYGVGTRQLRGTEDP